LRLHRTSLSLRSRRSWSCCAGSSASRCSSKLTWIAGVSRAHAHTQHSRASCSGTIEFDEFLSFFVEPVDMCALLFPAHTVHRSSYTPALCTSTCTHITSHFHMHAHHFTFPHARTSLHISTCTHITSHFHMHTHCMRAAVTRAVCRWSGDLNLGPQNDPVARRCGLLPRT
jgi:hypothetical protein